MKNNLPTKKEEKRDGLLARIKNFFRNLFYRSKEESLPQSIGETPEESTSSDIQKEEFDESLKVKVNNDVSNNIKREELLDQIEKNPRMLYDMPTENIEKVEQYYKDSIKIRKEDLET